jgi:uncharacterized repeat protein (TIGR01451 family)
LCFVLLVAGGAGLIDPAGGQLLAQAPAAVAPVPGLLPGTVPGPPPGAAPVLPPGGAPCLPPVAAAGPLPGPGAVPAPLVAAPSRGPTRIALEDDVAVLLTPHRMVAPIGSQVVLMAGVEGCDGYLRTNRRLEWSIAPGSAGQFVAIQQGGLTDFLVGDFTRPRKITNTYALGSTSRRCERLSRGTGNPADDILVAPGQGWITVSSPVEGTSHVTVHAPDVVCPNAAMQSAVIEWIDAQFGYPAPANNPAGTRHVFTTTVLRQSNRCPHVGWIVRYEIVGGPPAGFAPDGGLAVEVPTNAAGQASAEIFQAQPAEGSNPIRIQVIRPAEPRTGGAPAGSGDARLVVSSGCTQKTWSAAALSVCKTGPATAPVGSTVAYHIEVINPGDLPARDVTVLDQVPEGLDFLGGTPAPAVDGRRLEWRLGDLGPRQRQVLQANFRATQAGSIANRVEVTAAGGIHANHSATTTVLGAALDVRVTGPPEVAVGGQVRFEVQVTNRSQVPVTGLLLTDSFPEGLQFINPDTRLPAPSPIRNRLLGDLAPGQTKRTTVTFTVIRAGQLSHTVEVTGPEGVRAVAQGSVTAVETAGSGSAVPPPGTSTAPSAPLSGIPTPLAVRTTGPAQASVGQRVEFTLEVTNIGPKTLSNVQVTDQSDSNLRPELATEGHRVEGKNLVWTLRELAPGSKEQFRVQSRCERAAARACNRVLVTTPDGAHAGDEAYLEIREATGGVTPPSAPGGLTVSVDELQNPVVAGKPVTYIVRVANTGAAAESQVVVTVVAPPGVAVNRLQTSGPNAATKYELEGQKVLFRAVPEIAPGQSLTYRVQVLTGQPGEVQLHAEAVSREHPQAATGEKTTKVLPVNPPPGNLGPGPAATTPAPPS